VHFFNMFKSLLVSALLLELCSGFVLLPRKRSLSHSFMSSVGDDSRSYWLDEFKAPCGEILDPYRTLKIRRQANSDEIKKAYRELSKRYHPDTQRFRDVLPGSCNNLDDVRDEWERIKLSYEILRNPRSRKRYDRHEVLADPGAAVGRAVREAAIDAVGKGLSGIGSGIFKVGALALEKFSGEDKK
jgi:DnaJ-class molecular chaperone